MKDLRVLSFFVYFYLFFHNIVLARRYSFGWGNEKIFSQKGRRRLRDQSYEAQDVFDAVKESVTSTSSASASVSSPAWGPCPQSQYAYGIGYLKECIALQFPLDRSDPSLGNVNAFLRRLYAGSTPTNNTLWMIEGGPGFSTRPFIPAANYLIGQDKNLTVYLLDARGTGLSSLLTCNNSNSNDLNPGFYFNPYNNTELKIYQQCNEEIITKYSNVTKYYNTYSSAQDFLGAVNFVNPGTIAIYAFSYGTYFTNTYLQLPGARVDCLVFDGPVPPNRWVLEDEAFVSSWASQQVVNLCVQNSSVCLAAFGEMGNFPQLVSQAVMDRTLPCIEKIWWLNATGGHYRTAQFTNFMTGTQEAQVLLGPFWNRLYHCTDTDIDQLNHFYDIRTDEMTDSNMLSIYDYSYGLGTNLGVNELYTYEGNTTLTYDQQLLLTDQLFSTGGGALSTAYAIYESKFPRYKPNPSTYLKYANVTVPTLILVGTLDPETVQGLGVWMKNGLGNTTTLLTIPYAVHQTVNQDALCVDGIVSDFIATLGQGVINSTCLNDLIPPDFDGSEFETQSLALEYFGTTDLWNNDYQRDVPADTTTCTIYTTSSDSDSWSQSDVDKLIIGLTVPLGLIVLLLVAYIVYIHVFFVFGPRKPPLAAEANL